MGWVLDVQANEVATVKRKHCPAGLGRPLKDLTIRTRLLTSLGDSEAVVS
jgi:hypothetical protein